MVSDIIIHELETTTMTSITDKGLQNYSFVKTSIQMGFEKGVFPWAMQF